MAVSPPLGDRYSGLCRSSPRRRSSHSDAPGADTSHPGRGRGPKHVHRQRTTAATTTAAHTPNAAPAAAQGRPAGPAVTPGPRAAAPPRRTHLQEISDRIGAELDPLAVKCRGWPIEAVRPILAATWRRAFHSELGEPGLSDTATAISQGHSWTRGLWTDGW